MCTLKFDHLSKLEANNSVQIYMADLDHFSTISEMYLLFHIMYTEIYRITTAGRSNLFLNIFAWLFPNTEKPV